MSFGVVLTQDWHPAGIPPLPPTTPAAPFETDDDALRAADVLWPDHCVQGTAGAAFHPDLRTDPAHLIIRKGFRAAGSTAIRPFSRMTAAPRPGWMVTCARGA
jgi:nicotinamidase-related amidase